MVCGLSVWCVWLVCVGNDSGMCKASFAGDVCKERDVKRERGEREMKMKRDRDEKTEMKMK